MSTLDLTHSYWQIPLRAEDRKYTGFLHDTKSYQFRVLPFGLCTAVSSFTRAMDQILGPEFEEFVTPYVDDLLLLKRLNNILNICIVCLRVYSLQDLLLD